MSSTLPTLTVNDLSWTDAYVASGIAIGSAVTIQNQSAFTPIYVTLSESEPSDRESSFWIGPSESVFVDPDAGVNIYIRSSQGLANVFFTIDSIQNSQTVNQRQVVTGELTDRLAVQSLQRRDDLILRGYGYYSYYEIAAVAANSKVYAEFTTPPDKWVELTYREVTTDRARAFYRVYTGYGAVTEGASVRIGNLKASGPASGSTLKLVTNAPSLVGATTVTILPIFGVESVGGRSSGALTTNSIARAIPPSTKFLLEVDNQTADIMYALVELNWVELPLSMISDGGLS